MFDPKKPPKASKKNAAAASTGNLFELLAMEEQTRNQAFVSALQTQSLSRPLQGRALRCARHAPRRDVSLSLRLISASRLRVSPAHFQSGLFFATPSPAPRSAYALLCDNVLNKLTRKIPSMPPDAAALVSVYLSTLSQHRDLSVAARPDSAGFEAE